MNPAVKLDLMRLSKSKTTLGKKLLMRMSRALIVIIVGLIRTILLLDGSP